jgi:glycosyltransferase involved in cell wall biosynthesis
MVPEAASRISALSNGVDSEYFAPGIFHNPFPDGEVPIVMTGRMDYRANVDGAQWFLRDVMPLVAKELPLARFYVVGANPAPALRALSGSNIVVTGQVADVRPYLQHAAAVVAPLRIARGVQNKVLEAMAMVKPVVATRAATRALAVVSGVHVWIEDEPARFASAVIAAVTGEDRFHVARSARNYVERHHNWANNLATLDDLLADCKQPRDADQNISSVRSASSNPFVGDNAAVHSSSVSALQ